MHQIRSPHRWIRQHFFQISIDAPQGVPGVSKNSKNMLQIKVLSSWPFGSQNIKNGAFGVEFFPFIFLCVILLRQGAEMDLQHQKMNLSFIQLYYLAQFYIQFFLALKKLKKTPSKVQKNSSSKMWLQLYIKLDHLASIFNRQSLGDFTKVEGTQMEMFNFLWIIWVHYLHLTPTKKD